MASILLNKPNHGQGDPIPKNFADVLNGRPLNRVKSIQMVKKNCFCFKEFILKHLLEGLHELGLC